MPRVLVGSIIQDDSACEASLHFQARRVCDSLRASHKPLHIESQFEGYWMEFNNLDALEPCFNMTSAKTAIALGRSQCEWYRPLNQRLVDFYGRNTFLMTVRVETTQSETFLNEVEYYF